MISAPRVLSSILVHIVLRSNAEKLFSTACVTKAGEVFTWGVGSHGKLGHGDETSQQHPKRIEALDGVKIKHVSCGRRHTALCTEDGEVYTFGEGQYGRLGHGDNEMKNSPALVHALEGKHITQVQCGQHHTMALTSSGYVFTWGCGGNGRLGNSSLLRNCFFLPCLVEDLRELKVIQIAAKSSHCAVLIDPSPSPIRQSQLTSFNSKEHSDVVFMVENETLYAKVDVLSQKCDYFKGIFRSNMRESIERVVKLPRCSKAIVLQVLEYLCLDEFTVNTDHVVELWQVADMCQLEGLKYSCIGSLERGLCVENASQILQEAENLSCPCEG